MPEGPEVRNITRKLNIRLADANLINLAYLGQNLNVCGKIVGVGCKGKLIVFILEGERFISSTLGMTGSWVEREEKYTKAVMKTSVGTFYYNDMRGFGKISLLSEKELDKKLDKIGLDVLDYSLSLGQIPDQTWLSLFNRKSKKKICTFLLEQDRIAGIGNYLRSEILHAAEINPYRLLCTLDDDELLRLRDKAQELTVASYNSNGLTIKDYVDPDGERGTFVCSVYGRKVDPQGRKVKVEKVSGRSIYFVE